MSSLPWANTSSTVAVSPLPGAASAVRVTFVSLWYALREYSPGRRTFSVHSLPEKRITGSSGASFLKISHSAGTGFPALSRALARIRAMENTALREVSLSSTRSTPSKKTSSPVSAAVALTR